MNIEKKPYSLPCVRILTLQEKDVVTDSIQGVGYFNKEWITSNDAQGT